MSALQAKDLDSLIIDPRDYMDQDGNIDGATDYAVKVVNDDIMAGRWVKAACYRHLQDLKEGKHLWIGDQYLDLFGQFCYHCFTVKNIDGKKVPMELAPWQQFIIGNLLGWIVKSDDDHLKRKKWTRRFRHASVFTGKGSGKTSLINALDLYMLMADGYTNFDTGERIREVDVESFIVARTQGQAYGVAMSQLHQKIFAKKDWFFRYGIDAKGGKQYPRVINFKENGFLECKGSKAQGEDLSGYRIHYLHSEEMDDWNHREHLNALEANFKNRLQPLSVIASNAPKKRMGVAWRERNHAVAAALQHERDNYFAFIAEVDKDAPKEIIRNSEGKLEEKWYPSRLFWEQANPGIDNIIHEGYLYNVIENAKTDSQRRNVLRLNFSIIPGVTSDLLPVEKWIPVTKREKFDLPPPDKNTTLYIAIDIGTRVDMTAVSLGWEHNEKLRSKTYFWIAGTELDERDQSSGGELRNWVNDGFLIAPNVDILEYNEIIELLVELHTNYNTVICADYNNAASFVAAANTLGHDFILERKRNLKQIKHNLYPPQYKGIELLNHPQNFTYNKNNDLFMNASINHLRDMVYDDDLEVEYNPVLNWNLNCAEIKIGQNDRQVFFRPRGKAERESIDGIVSLTMLCGLYKRDQEYNDSHGEDNWSGEDNLFQQQW